MTAIRPRYGKAEYAQRGDALFEQSIRPHLKNRDADDFVAIDIDSGEFEVDADEDAASDRLKERRPDAQIWVRRIGSRFVRHFGAAQRAVQPSEI